MKFLNSKNIFALIFILVVKLSFADDSILVAYTFINNTDQAFYVSSNLVGKALLPAVTISPRLKNYSDTATLFDAINITDDKGNPICIFNVSFQDNSFAKDHQLKLYTLFDFAPPGLALTDFFDELYMDGYTSNKVERVDTLMPMGPNNLLDCSITDIGAIGIYDDQGFSIYYNLGVTFAIRQIGGINYK